jgi:hypothetical protein
MNADQMKWWMESEDVIRVNPRKSVANGFAGANA